MKCDDKSCSTTNPNSDKDFHPCGMCFFVLLFFITIPFMPWITAEITTPIRQMMIGDKGIQIYLRPEEWRQLRGITTLSLPLKDPVDNFDYIGAEGVVHDDVYFPEFMEFEGLKYEAIDIDKKTRIILYRSTEYSELSQPQFLGVSYGLFYDPIIHKVIGSSKDAFGDYVTLDGRHGVGGIYSEGSNYTKLKTYLLQNYNF